MANKTAFTLLLCTLVLMLAVTNANFYGKRGGGVEGKSLKELLQGMKMRGAGYASADDVLDEIERLIDTYRATQEVQGAPLGE